MNQEVPHRNTNSESRNGMNSTLFVLITNRCRHATNTSCLVCCSHEGAVSMSFTNRVLTMMDSGEAYMQMEKMVAAMPQKTLRAVPCRASSETSTTTAKMEVTMPRRPSIRSRAFRSAKMRKITT
jgi:hypothetical protein